MSEESEREIKSCSLAWVIEHVNEVNDSAKVEKQLCEVEWMWSEMRKVYVVAAAIEFCNNLFI